MENFEKNTNKRNNETNQISKRSNHKEDIYDNQISSNGLFIDRNGKNSKNLLKEKTKKRDSSTGTSLLLSGEHESLERKKRKTTEKEVEKRYIVDDIDNIFVLLKEPKLKLRIQEVLHYFIVFLICVYYWIFLFLTGIKFERNYYLTEYEQFDACSDEQMCVYPENSANVIIYNGSFNYFNFSSDENEFFDEESDIIK